MTFSVGHVAGGSHAGWKIQKPAPKPWECECSTWSLEDAARGRDVTLKTQPAYMSRCPDCGTRRP